MLTSEQTQKSPNLVLFSGVGTILGEDTCGVDTVSDSAVSLEAAIAIAVHVFPSAYKNQEIHINSGTRFSKCLRL